MFPSLAWAQPFPLPPSPGYGAAGWGLGLAWDLSCPDPSTQCPCGGISVTRTDTGTVWCPCNSSGAEKRSKWF